MKLILALLAGAQIAHADAPDKFWIGEFRAANHKGDFGGRKLATGPGVVALSKGDRSAPRGAVTIVNPRFGAIASGTIEKAKAEDFADYRIALASFKYNARSERDAGVFVFPGKVTPKIIKLPRKDLASLRDTIVAAGVLDKRNANKLEIGAVDIDADNRADLVMTYGCNGTVDGHCMSDGELVVIRRNGKWLLDNGDDAMESAAIDRLNADAACASQDRHDCDGDGSPFGEDRDDRNPKVQ